MLDGILIQENNMYIQKNLKWVEPFLSSVKDLVPLKQIQSIKGYSVPLNKEMNQYASITFNVYGRKKFRINIALKNNHVIINKQKPQFLAAFLQYFAHELSHTKHFEHSPEHFELEAQIMLRFARVLKKSGITDTYKRIKV